MYGGIWANHNNGYAQNKNIEKGRKVRTDCTCVESNIHHPNDSTLLWDAVGVSSRLIESCRDDYVLKVPFFRNPKRRAKRRMLAVLNAKNQKQRKAAYIDLLKISDKVLDYSRCTITDLAIPMLDRQKHIYGRYPLKVSFDGGFASKENLIPAKERKIKDVCFAKKRGLKETDMCRSEYVYHANRRFRAGIKSGISWLKRCMGLSRCTWKRWNAFKSYVWSSIVAANLLTIARVQLSET